MNMRVSVFLNKVNAAKWAYTRARSLYAAEVSPDFHMLGLLRPRELDLSRILAWMLDPTESQSQGEVFLLDFFDRLNISREACLPVTVILEETIADGRLDISLALADGRKVVIENKPVAMDQVRQLERYLIHVGERGHVIYLPGPRRSASEASISPALRRQAIAERRLIESSWIDLIPFFDACKNLSRSPRVRAFIEEIPRYIRAEFEGVTDLTETNSIIDQMAASSDSIETAYLVSSAMNGMRDRLIRKLNADVRSQLPAEWVVEHELGSWSGSLTFIQYPELRLRFYAGFEKANFVDFSYGLCWSPTTREPAKARILEVLKNHGFEAGEVVNSEKSFPLIIWGSEGDMIDLPKRWAMTPKPWQQIVDGVACTKIIDCSKALLPIAEELDSLLR